MNGPIVTIEIEAINGRIEVRPLCNLPHVQIRYFEVACRAKSGADIVAIGSLLVCGMLIDRHSAASMLLMLTIAQNSLSKSGS